MASSHKQLLLAAGLLATTAVDATGTSVAAVLVGPGGYRVCLACDGESAVVSIIQGPVVAAVRAVHFLPEQLLCAWPHLALLINLLWDPPQVAILHVMHVLLHNVRREVVWVELSCTTKRSRFQFASPPKRLLPSIFRVTSAATRCDSHMAASSATRHPIYAMW
jgi:hypothetical protein